MKKLALASAVALISAGVNAGGVATGTIVGMTVPCASTRDGGADGMVLDNPAGTVSCTICLDPTGTGIPYVMLGVSMATTVTPTTNAISMDTGAIQISLDWPTTNAWVSYSTINVSTTPISCTTSGSPQTLTCAATLL